MSRKMMMSDPVEKNQMLDHGLIAKKPSIMGVVNLTPDSFSDGGALDSAESAVAYCKKLIKAGADILDIGAESTRPGAERVSADEQLKRLLPVLKIIRKETDRPISIDTTLSKVAFTCLSQGADIINDISGFQHDPELAEVVSKANAGCVLMHSRGEPKSMQSMTNYDDLVNDVKMGLIKSLELAMKAGIKKTKIWIDPGIGFAKDAKQNILLIKNIETFKSLGFPVLVGPSRKSFLDALTGQKFHPSQRDWATAAVVAFLISKGVNVIRSTNSCSVTR